MATAMKIDKDGKPYGLSIGEIKAEELMITTDTPYITLDNSNGLRLDTGNNTIKMSNTNLFKKLADIFSELGWISKGGTVNVGGGNGYAYTSEAQFITEIRPLFLKHRIMMLPVESDTVSVIPFDKGQGKVSYMTTVNMKYELVDCDTGQSITVAMPGQGVDTGDKGVYKALTGALKYVLREAFLIGTGDDPEATDDEGRVVGKPNGRAETQADRGRRVIKEMLGQMSNSKDIVSGLKKHNLDVNNLPEDLNTLKAVYNFIENIQKGNSLIDADGKLTEELGN